jgi:hypothetical protein
MLALSERGLASYSDVTGELITRSEISPSAMSGSNKNTERGVGTQSETNLESQDTFKDTSQ